MELKDFIALHGKNRQKRRCRFHGILFLLILALLCGCSAEEEGRGPAPPEIEKTYVNDPFQLVLSVSEQEISVAGQTLLGLRASAPEQYTVEFPAFNGQLGEFTILDIRTPDPELLPGGHVQVEKTLVVEPFLAGDYTLPAMKIMIREAEGIAGEFITEEIAISVHSLLGDEPDPQLGDLMPPESLPDNRVLIWWTLAGVLFLLILGFLWWRYVKKARIEPRPVPEAPHILANRALDALLNSGLLEKGEFKRFYIKVSDILRTYIEGRFGLKAPERTTEEF
ncbi:hypothetical protein ACFL6N_03935, partial [Thermodesulfobacteriota bacterium]